MRYVQVSCFLLVSKLDNILIDLKYRSIIFNDFTSSQIPLYFNSQHQHLVSQLPCLTRLFLKDPQLPADLWSVTYSRTFWWRRKLYSESSLLQRDSSQFTCGGNSRLRCVNFGIIFIHFFWKVLVLWSNIALDSLINALRSF